MPFVRPLAFTVLVACGVLASSCSSPVSRGLESVHQPVVSRTDHVFDVAASGGERLAPEDADRLNSWFSSLKLGYGDRVSVDAPDGRYGVREAVAEIAAHYGVSVDAQVPVTEGEILPGMMRVVVSRMTATVPHCPDFSRLSNPQFSGSQSSNYGCAMNSNLAAMVANPYDLIAGRQGDGVADNATSTKAIRAYRTAPPTGATGLKIETTKAGSN